MITFNNFYLKSRGSKDWAASLSIIYCNGWCKGWISSCKAILPMHSNSPAIPASHITCWFLSERTKLLIISAMYNCRANASCGFEESDIDGSKWSIPTTIPGWTTIGSGVGGLRFKGFMAHLFPLPGESKDFCCWKKKEQE